MSFVNTAGTAYVGTTDSSGGSIITGGTAYALSIRPPSGKVVQFGKGDGTGPTVTIDNSGNLTMIGALTATSGTFAGNVTPSVDSSYALGENTNRWAYLFADTIYGNGANITSLSGSNISSGTVAAARLGTGSSITSKFLRGDNTWQTVSSGSGTVTSIGITPGTGLDVSNSPITSSGNITVSLDLSEFTDMTADITTTDEVILLDSGAERKKAFGELKLSKFNNDSGWINGSSLNASNLDTGTVPGTRLGNVYPTSSSSDVLSVSNGAISAVDGNTDKLVFWDDSAGKLKYLTFSDLTALP